MKKTNLDDAFNVEVSDTPENGCSPRKDQLANVTSAGLTKPDRLTKDDITKDYEYTRGNLYSIIEKGQEAINGILYVAQNSDHPRAYEVAGTLIKNVADITDKLVDLQGKMKDINQEKKQTTNNVTNAMFVGSTSELQKMLKEMGKDK